MLYGTILSNHFNWLDKITLGDFYLKVGYTIYKYDITLKQTG